MEDIDVRTAFLRAAVMTAGVVGSAAVAEHWAHPSTLEKLSVGGLAGHTYLAARRASDRRRRARHHEPGGRRP